MKPDFLDVKKYHVVIEGITPVRQSKRPEKSFERKWNGASYPDKEQLQWACDIASYYDEQIGFYQPAEQVRKALIYAGARRKVPGDARRTFSNLLASSIFIEPEKLIHKNQKAKDVGCVCFPTVREDRGKMNQVYSVVREIDNWELEFDVVNTQPDILRDEYLGGFLDYAGLYCGLGVGRPQRGRHYGRFKVKLFKVVK